jgi:hypothetical protein
MAFYQSAMRGRGPSFGWVGSSAIKGPNFPLSGPNFPLAGPNVPKSVPSQLQQKPDPAAYQAMLDRVNAAQNNKTTPTPKSTSPSKTPATSSPTQGVPAAKKPTSKKTPATKKPTPKNRPGALTNAELKNRPGALKKVPKKPTGKKK